MKFTVDKYNLDCKYVLYNTSSDILHRTVPTI